MQRGFPSVLGIIGAALLFMGIPVVQAQQAPILVPEVVITATKTEIPVGQTVSSVTVITGEQLQQMGVMTVLEALRQVPGLDVTQTGGPGKLTSVLMRGVESKHTMVIMDGVPLNSPTLGTTDFAALTVDNIERIEIIRGPQSPLYGSDAIGGVIQIITRRATSTQAVLSVEAGSFGTAREVVSTQVKKEDYDVSLSASRWDTEGISSYKGGAEKDATHHSILSMRLGKTTGSGRIDLTTRLSEGTIESDDFNFADNPAYEQNDRRALVGLQFRSPIHPAWEQIFSASVNAERMITRDPNNAFSNSRTDTEIRLVEWRHNIGTSPTSRLTLGAEGKEESGENSGSSGSFNQSITSYGFFLQDHRGVGTPFEFLAGARWDGNSQYEDIWTYRILVSATTPNNSRWHLQYGTGFHGPDLNDLFYPLDPFGYAGNPQLKPEKSRGWEAGVQKISDPWTVRITYFRNRIRNLIQWPINPGMPTNVAEAESSGIEGEVLWKLLPSLRLGMQYTYDDTEDKETGGYLLRRPLNKYSFQVETGVPGRNLGIRSIHVGRRFEANDNQSPVAAYDRIDLYGTYRYSDRMEIYGRIENLSDKEYEEAKGFGTPGYSTYAGIRLSF